MNSRDVNAAISPDIKDHSKILDTESVVDSLMAGMWHIQITYQFKH